MPSFTLQASLSNIEGEMPGRFDHETPRRPHDNSGHGTEMSLTPMERRQAELLRPMERGTPGEVSDRIIAARSPEEAAAAKLRTQFYSDVFAVREPPIRELTNSPRERLKKSSIVVAEMKTNIIINEEFDFLAHLASNLSTIYERPMSSIMVSLGHAACMLFGASCEPTYLLTISAIPSFTTTAMNKHSASCLQNFIEEELKCPADRGVVRFTTTPEENLAVGGITLSQRIDEMRLHVPAPSNVPSLSRQSTLIKAKTPPFQQQNGQPQSTIPTPPHSPHNNTHEKTPRASRDPSPKETVRLDRSKSMTSMKRRKHSIIDTSSIPIPDIPVTSSPTDSKTSKSPRVGKRKSLLQMLASSGRSKAEYGNT